MCLQSAFYHQKDILVLCVVERIVNIMSPEDAEEIRRGPCRNLSTAKPPKPNLSRKEGESVRHFRDDENLVFLPAD